MRYPLRGGGDGSLGSSTCPTHPPTSEKFSSGKKMKFIQRGPKLEVDFRYTNLFFGL